MFGLIARWTAKPEHLDQVMDALARMTVEVEANEPGCLMYHSNIETDRPNVIVLYERYVDEAAFAVHGQTDYFKTIVLGEIVPLLEQRERINLTPVH